MSMHKVIALYTKDLPSLFHHPILSLSPLLEAASAQASRCYPSNLQGCQGSGSRMGYLDRNNKQTGMVDLFDDNDKKDDKRVTQKKQK